MFSFKPRKSIYSNDNIINHIFKSLVFDKVIIKDSLVIELLSSKFWNHCLTNIYVHNGNPAITDQ